MATGKQPEEQRTYEEPGRTPGTAEGEPEDAPRDVKGPGRTPGRSEGDRETEEINLDEK